MKSSDPRFREWLSAPTAKAVVGFACADCHRERLLDDPTVDNGQLLGFAFSFRPGEWWWRSFRRVHDQETQQPVARRAQPLDVRAYQRALVEWRDDLMWRGFSPPKWEPNRVLLLSCRIGKHASRRLLPSAIRSKAERSWLAGFAVVNV